MDEVKGQGHIVQNTYEILGKNRQKSWFHQNFSNI